MQTWGPARHAANAAFIAAQAAKRKNKDTQRYMLFIGKTVEEIHFKIVI